MTISLVNGVNPLQTTLLELGIVSGRVALLLRSAEIQPVFGRFVTEWQCHSPPIHTLAVVLLPGGFGACRFAAKSLTVGMQRPRMQRILGWGKDQKEQGYTQQMQ
jgi:hypothetical protein